MSNVPLYSIYSQIIRISWNIIFKWIIISLIIDHCSHVTPHHSSLTAHMLVSLVWVISCCPSPLGLLGMHKICLFLIWIGTCTLRDYKRWMRLMWIPLTTWNHITDGFEHLKLDQVSNCKSRPKNLKSLKLEFR